MPYNETNGNTAVANRTKTPPPRRLSFEVDQRISIMIDFDLACDLRKLITRANPENPALIAFRNALPRDDEPETRPQD